jgi:hypothetical protein
MKDKQSNWELCSCDSPDKSNDCMIPCGCNDPECMLKYGGPDTIHWDGTHWNLYCAFNRALYLIDCLTFDLFAGESLSEDDDEF